MTNSERLFLLLAEENNFHRTAEKAYITQQCLSDHIKRLETQYGAALFTRRPNVALTEAGTALRRMLLQMQGLEQGLKNELAEIAAGERGRLRIGANHTRAQFFIAEFFKRYQQHFPLVNIEVFSEETTVLSELLLRGEIDLFLGVNSTVAPPLQAQLLSHEQVCLLVSPAYLQRYLGEKAAKYLQPEAQVSLADFDALPFVMNHSTSTLSIFIQRYLAENDLRLDCRIAITDYNVIAQLCRSGEVAGFCPEFLCASILARNGDYPPEEQLSAFPVTEMGHPLRFELIRNGMLHYPRYIQSCFEEIQTIFANKELLLG